MNLTRLCHKAVFVLLLLHVTVSITIFSLKAHGSHLHVCVLDMENAIQSFSLVPWRQHLKRPFTAKPEM